MSDNDENSRSASFGALGSLVKNPLLTTSNEADVESNEVPTSSVKETSETTGEKTTDFDPEDIERQMNNLIQEFKSDSVTPDDPSIGRRKSVTSAHLINGKENSSAPIIDDSMSNHPPKEPRRSMSESVLTDTNEMPSTLPIQQVESTTDDDTDEANVSKKDQPVKPIQSKNSSRKSSASQQRPPSALSGERRAQIPDDPDQEVANISRRSSNNASPINRPRSPRPDDARRTPTIAEPNRPASSSSSSSNHQKQTFGPPIAIVSPASRQPSAHKSDQQRPGSRPSTAKRSELHADNTSESSTHRPHSRQLTDDEHSKLIKQGEQLQIPTSPIDNQRLNSPPPSPSIKELMVLSNPLLEKTTPQASQKNSRPGSQTSRKSSVAGSVNNEKHQQSDVVSNKSRTSSRASQQRSKVSDTKVTSARNSGRESPASEREQKSAKDSRRSSTDVDVPIRTSAKQKQERPSSDEKPKSPLEKRSAQASRKNSSNTAERTVTSPIKVASAKSQQKTEKRLSTSDSDNERKVPKLPRLHSSSEASTPRNDNQTNAWTKQAPVPALPTTDDDIRASRPQSPNVEQIAERNQHSSSSKKRITNERKQKEPKRRSNSAESFNQIRMVDDRSLDSTSGNNTESDRPKQRRVKSKKKDVETNTDARNGNQQQQETTSQKSSKSMTSQSPSIRRRIGAKQYEVTTPDTDPDSNTPTARRTLKKAKTPVPAIAPSHPQDESTNENFRTTKEKEDILAVVTDQERHTQSDTEQVIGKKQKKRRRPKRISRTTQTYECVFRRMERDQHEELLPTNDTEKCVQTRRSCLRPITRSPRRHHPLYLSTDAFKIEEILPKQLVPSQRSTNVSRTTITARNASPQGGKLLILRPTLPFHHTDAVNVQRINLQYSIDLIPNENKSIDAAPGQRNKSNALKSSEDNNTLPMIRSSSSSGNPPPPTTTTTKNNNTKEKPTNNKFNNRFNPRKTGDGTV